MSNKEQGAKTMREIVREVIETHVGEVCDIETKKVVFYEKAVHHFIAYSDNSGELTITRKKISKKTYEKLQKMLDKSKQV
jgi:hypothetical protein